MSVKKQKRKKIPDVGARQTEMTGVLMRREHTARLLSSAPSAAEDAASARMFSAASFEKQKSRERITMERLRK